MNPPGRFRHPPPILVFCKVKFETLSVGEDNNWNFLGKLTGLSAVVLATAVTGLLVTAMLVVVTTVTAGLLVVVTGLLVTAMLVTGLLVVVTGLIVVESNAIPNKLSKSGPYN